jgi:hypothetical protein
MATRSERCKRSALLQAVTKTEARQPQSFSAAESCREGGSIFDSLGSLRA